MEMSSTSMNAAMETTAATIHGLRLPAAERSGVQPRLPLAVSDEPATSAHRHPRFDGHARTERAAFGHRVEQDLHRNSLHDLHVVASGVLRRQQGEGLACTALDRVD